MSSRRVSPYNVKSILILCSILGLLIGILVANLFFSNYINQMDSLISMYIKQYKYMEINSEELLIYLIKSRLIIIVILAFLGNTKWNNITMMVYCLWLGFSSGMFVALVTIQGGTSGMLLSVVSLLPQYLLYIPAYLLLFYGMIRRGEIVREGRDYSGERTRYMGIAIAVVVLFLIGIWLETYVNPMFTKNLLKNY